MKIIYSSALPRNFRFPYFGAIIFLNVWLFLLLARMFYFLSPFFSETSWYQTPIECSNSADVTQNNYFSLMYITFQMPMVYKDNDIQRIICSQLWKFNIVFCFFVFVNKPNRPLSFCVSGKELKSMKLLLIKWIKKCRTCKIFPFFCLFPYFHCGNKCHNHHCV